MASIVTYKAKGLKPIKDHVLVRNMEFNERLSKGGIILPSDDKKAEGIRPRWAEVYAIGPDQKDVKVGQWVLVAHGRWTRGLKMEVGEEELTLRRVDVNDIMLVSDEPQVDETFSTAMSAHSDLNRIHGSLHKDGTQSDI